MALGFSCFANSHDRHIGIVNDRKFRSAKVGHLSNEDDMKCYESLSVDVRRMGVGIWNMGIQTGASRWKGSVRIAAFKKPKNDTQQ
jgi:hypothetical protein